MRIDTGVGRGHHTHVRTAGTRSKFGVPLVELQAFARQARAGAGARIAGLQAHVGSGIFDVTSWEHTARLLAGAGAAFGGRAGHRRGRRARGARSTRPGAASTSASSTRCSRRCAPSIRSLEVWLEPGRYLVAAAGVLLARVTQLKSKGGVRFVGRRHRHELADPSGALWLVS